jgi:hypothetical protein
MRTYARFAIEQCFTARALNSPNKSLITIAVSVLTCFQNFRNSVNENGVSSFVKGGGRGNENGLEGSCRF